MLWMLLGVWVGVGLLVLVTAWQFSPAATLSESEWTRSVRVSVIPDTRYAYGYGGTWTHYGFQKQREWLRSAFGIFVLWFCFTAFMIWMAVRFFPGIL